MVGGNPAERGYDNFIDSIRDRDGNYRDDIIYEIINKKIVL